jgi:hypothetical protein
MAISKIMVNSTEVPLTGATVTTIYSGITYSTAYVNATDCPETLAVGKPTTKTGNLRVTDTKYKRLSDGKVIPLKIYGISEIGANDKMKLNGAFITPATKLMDGNATMTATSYASTISKGTIFGMAVTVEDGSSYYEYAITGTDLTNAVMTTYFNSSTVTND